MLALSGPFVLSVDLSLAGLPMDMDFALEALAAFKKRTRAISRRGAEIECGPVKEIVNGVESERSRVDIEIAYRVDAARVKLRLHVWGDRWVWVDARRQSKAGWVWEFTMDGRFISPQGARDLVARAEATISASHLPQAELLTTMSSLWSKCLASGPKRI
jgi:hypothetical protein